MAGRQRTKAIVNLMLGAAAAPAANDMRGVRQEVGALRAVAAESKSVASVALQRIGAEDGSAPSVMFFC